MLRDKLLAIVLLLTSACKSVTYQSELSAKSFGPISEISIGDSKTSVIKKMGPPTTKNSEKFPSAEYEVLEYSKNDGIPIGYISLDPDGHYVAGRSIWISEAQPEQDFVYLQARLFPQTTFETLISCDKYHADEVRVDQSHGIFVGMRRGHVILVSWSDPRLSKLRVEQFFLKCPERQKHE